MKSPSVESAEQTPTSLTLFAQGGLTVLLSDLMRLKLLRQASSSVQLLFLQSVLRRHLFRTSASTFSKRVLSAAQFEALHYKYQHKHSQRWWQDEIDEATFNAVLLWCLTPSGSVVLLRQGEAEWLVLGFGEKNALAPATLLFECLLYDLYPGHLQVREATVCSGSVDASVFSLAAARSLLPTLRTTEDLQQLTSVIPSDDFESLIEEVKEVIQEAAGLSADALEDLMRTSERFMAQKYLEVAFGPTSSVHSKSSSQKTSVCSHSFVLDNAHLQTSTDVTSHRLSSSENSSEPASRLEDPPRFAPQVLRDSLEEEVSDPEELKHLASPEAANTGPLFSWTSVPPMNRVPENETLDGRWTTEESESRSELMFIEYSHQSPRNTVLPRLTMSEISEDEDEEGRTQLDPRFFEGLAMEDYAVGFLSTTPKFRVLPAVLDFEEPKKQRPPSFSSCEFASVALESPCSVLTPPKTSSPESSGEVEVENTMGRVFLEPKRNRLPRSLGQNQAFPDLRGDHKTCGPACTLL